MLRSFKYNLFRSLLCVTGANALEQRSKAFQKQWNNLLHLHYSVKFFTQAGHPFIFDPARHDVREPFQVVTAIYRQSVCRDESTPVDPYRTHLNVFPIYLKHTYCHTSFTLLSPIQTPVWGEVSAGSPNLLHKSITVFSMLQTYHLILVL